MKLVKPGTTARQMLLAAGLVAFICGVTLLKGHVAGRTGPFTYIVASLQGAVAFYFCFAAWRLATGRATAEDDDREAEDGESRRS